jgi:hypothetical protein
MSFISSISASRHHTATSRLHKTSQPFSKLSTTARIPAKMKSITIILAAFTTLALASPTPIPTERTATPFVVPSGLSPDILAAIAEAISARSASPVAE